MYDVVAIGELLIDFTTLETNAAGYPLMQAHPGGAPGNFLAAMSAYGAKTAFLGKVGDDAFGRLLIHTLEAAGIDAAGVRVDPAVFTTLAFVTRDARGERSFSFARKPGADAMLRPEEIDLSCIDQARILHFGTLSLTDEPARAATQLAVTHAKLAGKRVTFDPNLRLSLWPDPETARQQILWGLGQADVVKISDEEAAFLFGACAPEEAAARLLDDFKVSLVLLTLGAKGCLLQNRLASARASCPKVSPVDTTGAGDIFGGSAMGRMLRLGKAPEALTGDQLMQIARFAVTAASISTERQGGISSIPSEAEVLARM